VKSAFVKLVAALLVAALAGWGAYHWRTAPVRAMLCCQRPEIAWLQHEFKVNAKDADRVYQLHEAYLSQCAALCAQIDATNALIRVQLETAGAVTPDIEKMLGDAAQLRVTCQKNMLGYFVEVSKFMPPEESKRYLAWMEGRVFSMSHESMDPGGMSMNHGN
jgi:hypothetical protein